ncbi:hypothetical protein [Pantoea sp. 18069]|uniref:hypothetical protein n=1 Tax=Pantoea sp. 18069 TaxID=2681415 RepID=UPI00135B47C0|nr:hypothetical protein [Pantoea sp. 18069]
MERRQLLYGFTSLLFTPYLVGCGAGRNAQTLNEILASQLDLTVIPPEEIDIASSNLEEIYITDEALVY